MPTITIFLVFKFFILNFTQSFRAQYLACRIFLTVFHSPAIRRREEQHSLVA